MAKEDIERGFRREKEQFSEENKDELPKDPTTSEKLYSGQMESKKKLNNNSSMNIKSEVNRMITEGLRKEALELISKHIEGHYQNDIIMLQARLNSLERDMGRGIIDPGRAQVNMNQITASILSLSEKLPDPPKRKILFLAASPTDGIQLKVADELALVREILSEDSEETFELLFPQLSVTLQDFITAMNQEPEIVHFSGHGLVEGIVISTPDNESQLIPLRALKRLFKQHRESVNYVLLNACYSAEQAQSISELSIYVIGMNAPIGDPAAIEFAGGLYLGLSAGKGIHDAFDDAMITIETKHPKYSDLPEVWFEGRKLDW